VAQELSLTLETLNDQSLITLHQSEDHFYSFSGLDHGSAFAGRFGDPHVYGVTAAGTRSLDSDSDLAQFTGCGFVDLVLSARSRLGAHFNGAGGILESFLTAGANITVTYDYAPVSD